MSRPYTQPQFEAAFNRFNFEKVRALMLLTKHVWRGAPEPPTVDELKATVQDLYFNLEYGEHYRDSVCRCSTGGFSVYRFIWQSSVEIEILYKFESTSSSELTP